MIKKIFAFIFSHKVISGFLASLIVIGGYFGYGLIAKGGNQTRYVLAAVQKGTLVTSVSGSGQVLVSNQVDIKSKVSGNVLSVNVKDGQDVKNGAFLLEVDPTNANKAIRDAKIALQSAQLSLDKLKEPAADSALLQAENDLQNSQNDLVKLKLSQQNDYQNSQQAVQKSNDDLKSAYDNVYNSIASTYNDLPSLMDELYSVFFSYDISKNDQQTIGQISPNSSVFVIEVLNTNLSDRDKVSAYINDIQSEYSSTKTAYDAALAFYKNTNRSSDNSSIESLFTKTVTATQQVADLAKLETTALDFWVNYRITHGLVVFGTVSTYQTDLSNYASQINSHLSALLSAQSSLTVAKNGVISANQNLTSLTQNNPLDLAAAEVTVKSRQLALDNLKAGADSLDIQAQELAVKQRQNALADAQDQLSDYYISAPFDGVVGKINVKVGDPVSSGDTLATIITKQMVAQVSLNEVDVSKVKVGQSVTLTFDAISDLTITGKVADVDTIGTVSQGVVTYNVQIVFDTQDNRVKPGMSVSAAIITDVKPDALLVPSSAVKSQGSVSYVETLQGPQSPQLSANVMNSAGIASLVPPQQVQVEVGLSNNSQTEVTSGLKEGDMVVIRTITPSVSQPTSGQNIFQASGASRNVSGGNARFLGR